MRGVPAAAAALGLAGLIPFVWAAASLAFPSLYDWASGWMPDRFLATFAMIDYGMIIFCFMAGVFWGFAARSSGFTATFGYALSVIPPIYLFLAFADFEFASSYLWVLLAGFLGLLPIDRFFWVQKLAPEWWMRLRVPLTAVVCLCLLTGIVL